MFFGAPLDQIDADKAHKTYFYDDEASGSLIGIVPAGAEMEYFGYLKKMSLTLHNIKTMKKGSCLTTEPCSRFAFAKGRFQLPHHGGFRCREIRNAGSHACSGGEEIDEINIIADDMGSLRSGRRVRFLAMVPKRELLSVWMTCSLAMPLDRSIGPIIMNANQINARVVLPVTTYERITAGTKVDYVFYANNYEKVDDTHPILGRFFQARKRLLRFFAVAG